MEIPCFVDFHPETMDFLWGIRMNNERSWFLAHKTTICNTCTSP